MSPEVSSTLDEPNKNEPKDWSRKGSWNEFVQTHPQLFENGKPVYPPLNGTYETSFNTPRSPVTFEDKCVELSNYLSADRFSAETITIKGLITSMALETVADTPEHQQFQNIIAWYLINSDTKPTHTYVTQKVTELLTDDSVAYLYLTRMRGSNRWHEDWIPLNSEQSSEQNWCKEQEVRFANQSKDPIDIRNNVAAVANFGQTLIRVS
jgi:hypothetical protein